MEDHLIDNLALEEGSKVLDAGCGVGHVSIHLAEKGYQLQAIDVVDRHIMKARRNVKARGLDGKITINKGDCHHLNAFADGSFDGVFTMETFVHATEPEAAAAEFFRVLRPGGSLALFATGVLEGILEDAGFVEVVVKDLSYNVLPMLRLFYLLAFIPYMIIAFLGLQAWFVNTVAKYEGYVYRYSAQYIAVSARKPLDPRESDLVEKKKVR
ncbi:S-adenosyl-L-methionine-dependent methyltransferase [Leptodontidium sp. 2 PMI_412]|nr:S-adenosyl-L-methionine-dependent methyltransferase [Leptodontidium sp. 2 PMI_412]